MKKEEKELFKALCSFKSDRFDDSLLAFATPAVLGNLFFNRMHGVAYGTLSKHGLLGKVNREFKNSLFIGYNQGIERNRSFYSCVEYVGNILDSSGCRYAMLKGAYLCRLYPRGYRTSNDIDILTEQGNVTDIARALESAGFGRGYIRNGEFEPATRREIIESKMMRGETVPFIKEVGLEGMRFLEADINFSLDYKPDDRDLPGKMIAGSKIRKIDDFSVRTLRRDDFFIHLCAHLYKEATTLPWVEMMRDMTMYKYMDIYMLLSGADKDMTDRIFERARELSLEKMCAFAIIQTAALFDFDNVHALSAARDILKDDLKFINTVVSPSEHKTYVYREKDVEKRFFSDNRRALLEEARAQ